jgi:uncharacterized membrane protein
MNPTHIHLLINHLPVFGALSGLIALIYALWSKSNQTKVASYLIFIVAAAGGAIAYLTGEDAEESVEDLAGVSKNIIEMHEDAAFFALIAFIIVGIASLAGIYISKNKPSWSKATGYIVLILSLWAFSVVARTAYIGGQIRHSEIRTISDVPEHD